MIFSTAVAKFKADKPVAPVLVLREAEASQEPRVLRGCDAPVDVAQIRTGNGIFDFLERKTISQELTVLGPSLQRDGPTGDSHPPVLHRTGFDAPLKLIRSASKVGLFDFSIRQRI